MTRDEVISSLVSIANAWCAEDEPGFLDNPFSAAVSPASLLNEAADRAITSAPVPAGFPLTDDYGGPL